MKTHIKGDKKVLNAWAFYDWANSVYALVISSSIFPLFYGALFRLEDKESASFFGVDTPSESIISYVTAIGFLIIAFISPLLSGVADYLGNKKFFLKLFCFVGSVSCMMLYFFDLNSYTNLKFEINFCKEWIIPDPPTAITLQITLGRGAVMIFKPKLIGSG